MEDALMVTSFGTMEETEAAARREIQMFRRGERSRATVSKSSALGMEIKRKQIRESALFPEHSGLQVKLDFELRMRDGIRKLLSVSTQREQILNAVKNLMICNQRIQLYMKAMRAPCGDTMGAGRRSSDVGVTERLACAGTLAISGIRIPLMWRDAPHFIPKEKSPRCAVFCLLKLHPEIFDTDLVFVDKTTTDICFENTVVFAEARPDFEMKLEVYSCCMEESPLANTPRKLARKLCNSIGKKSYSDSEDGVFSNPHMPGARYNLLAHITLTLDSVEDGFRTHNLTITGHEACSYWLPLYGGLCCRLVAQPSCITDQTIAGFLNQQEMVGGVHSCIRLYCVLTGGELHCYYTPEEIDAKIQPTITIPINKETRIRAVDKESRTRTNRFSIITPVPGEARTKIFAAESRQELHRWMEAFWQHFYNLSQWKHCSEQLMKIEIMSPPKPPLFLTKEATSVYHDMRVKTQ